ncbi:hypothetical protein HGRIS_014556 [Hohenbuehelia grisea]|uniref:Uncharacterized protein n=1 Tax=Hohenbuehelia grisea TaxID=104357 RepID=A0ABR3JW15_9AGAR
MHRFGKFPDSLLNDSSALGHWSSAEHNRTFDGGVRYSLTKLLNMLFVLGLSDRLPRTSPTVIVTGGNPGYCISELRRDLGGVIGSITRVWTASLGIRARRVQDRSCGARLKVEKTRRSCEARM